MQEVHALINDILGEYADGKYIFRGTNRIHSNKANGIQSSLYRWTKKNGLNEYFSPLDMEKDIVKKARGLFPPGTSNIEILTDLRHYGGNVNLIDFSRSLHVALFFACSGHFDRDGELVALKIDTFDRIDDIDYSAKEPQIAIIEPANSQASHRRTIAQSSVFVVAPAGYIDKDTCRAVAIEGALKLKIRKYLRNFHNMYSDTIYNDLIGFIANQENNTIARAEFYRGRAKQDAGDSKGSIVHYDRATELNT